jgi:glutamate synthase (NADPH/NADH) large chain
LIGFGAGTVNPYLVFESLVDLERDGYFPEGLDAADRGRQVHQSH